MISMFQLVLVALIAWSSMYSMLIWFWSQDKYEWHCRVVTFVHAVLIVMLSGWSVFVQGPWPFTDPAGPNTFLQEFTCAISFGYFIFDFTWCIYFRTEGPVMLFHHVLSMFGGLLILLRGINGCELMAALFGTELTNPLLQTRWFIRHTSLAIPVFIKEMVDLAFLMLFTFMRIGLGSALLFCYLSHPRPDLLARAGALAIYLVGWVFWVALIRYAWRKYVVSKPPHDGKHTSPSTITDLMNGEVGDSHAESDRIKQVPKCSKTPSYMFGGGEPHQRFLHHEAELNIKQ